MFKINLILASLVSITTAFAQLPGEDSLNAEEKKLIENVTPVTNNIFMLQGRGGNIGVLRGNDGVYMVDDQYANASASILQTISLLSDKPLKMVVNTHHHADHTGGNENMKNAGAIILAHKQASFRMNQAIIEEAQKKYQANLDNKIKKLKQSSNPSTELEIKQMYARAEKDTGTINDYMAENPNTPHISFTGDLDIHFNEDFKVIHLKSAHTDGDVIVQYPKSNVIQTGDIYFQGKYPFIDTNNGGSAAGALNALQTIAKMSNDETKIIPGHGNLSNLEELNETINMLRFLIDRVTYLVASGQTKAQVTSNREITKPYDDKDFGDGFITTEKFLEMLYDEAAKKLKK